MGHKQPQVAMEIGGKIKSSKEIPAVSPIVLQLYARYFSAIVSHTMLARRACTCAPPCWKGLKCCGITSEACSLRGIKYKVVTYLEI